MCVCDWDWAMSDHGQYTGCCWCGCCFFKLACCSLYPLADLLVVVVFLHIAAALKTGFVYGMCTSVCCCRRRRRRRLLQPLAVIWKASPDPSGQMGTAFKFREASRRTSLPLKHPRTNHITCGINTFVYVEILQRLITLKISTSGCVWVCVLGSMCCPFVYIHTYNMYIQTYVQNMYVFICCRCWLCIHPE